MPLDSGSTTSLFASLVSAFPFLIAFTGDLSVFCRLLGIASGTAFAGFGCLDGFAEVLASGIALAFFTASFGGLADGLFSTTAFAVFAACLMAWLMF